MPSLAERLTACGAVKFGEFTLTSGAISPYYVDVKLAMSDPATLRAMADQIASVAASHGPFDLVAGMELGAIPLATAASLAMDLPMVMIRKGRRAHGTGRRLEGPDVDGKRVLVVEDVATSGGSTRESIQVLRAAGAMVHHAIVVVDRQHGGGPVLAAHDVSLHSLVQASDLLEASAGGAA